MTISEVNSDDQIVYLLGKEDPQSMRMIFDRYYDRLCAYVMRYPLTWHDAEDIVQSVMISFWNNKKHRDFSGSLKAYLFAAVSKSALKRLRDSKQPYFTRIESLVNQSVEEIVSGPEDHILALHKRLNGCIGDLSEQQQQVLNSIAVQNKPYKEVALSMGISVNTVKTHYIRALRSLRSRLVTEPEGVK